MPRQWHLVHLGQFAIGGAGLVMAEASAVSQEGRITDEDTGLWNDEQRDAWSRIVEFIHSQGAAAGIQLAHAGRKASTYPQWSHSQTGTMPPAEGGWQTVSASPVAFGELDAYGGSLRNRAKLLIQTVNAVRAEVGDTMPILVRFSATDYTHGGWDQEQTAIAAGWAVEAGADFFDISSGGNIADAAVPLGPAIRFRSPSS